VPRRKPPPAQPALLEWNFDGFPADELSLARSYEYTRSSALIRETVQRKREGGEDSLCGALYLVFPINSLWIISGAHCHWWPDTPYLAIPRAERRSHLILPPSRPRKDLADFCAPGPAELHDAERLVLVYVPPGWPLSRIKQAFGQLIERDYPHLLEKPVQRFKWRWTKRGAGSTLEQCRTDLKALSAWRLRESGYTASQALELAHSHRVSMYASERSLRNAARKAKAKIAQLEERLRDYAAKREPR
jgi:hypothetical protein